MSALRTSAPAVSGAVPDDGDRADLEVPGAAGRRQRLLVMALRLAVAVVVLGTWELGTRSGVLDEFFFSRPSAIADQVREWVVTGYLWPHLLVTLEETALGLLIGVSAGIFVGFGLARWRLGSEIFLPYVKLLNAMPRVVFAPLFLLWFGIGVWSKVALAVSLVFFVVFFNAYRGVLDVNPVMVDNARMLGASERQLTRHIFIPSALVWIFSSLHMAVGFAIIGVVVGEFVGASEGVGYVINQAQGTLDTGGVMAGITVLLVLVLVLDTLIITPLERHLLRWKPERGPA